MVDKINDAMTEDELVAILRAAAEAVPDNEPGTITAAEYAAAADLTDYRARLQLRELVASGVIRADWIRRVNRWGTATRIMGYRYTGRD